MPDLQEVLGRIIRQERQYLKLTMKEFGEKAGVSEIYVGEIERGQKYPSAKVLESLAHALDLDIATLLELVASELRQEQETHMTHVIGFTLPSHTKQRSGSGNKRVMNMLSSEILEESFDMPVLILPPRKLTLV